MSASAATHLHPVRLALSYEFVEERNGLDWGDVWVWDLDDSSQRTVEWLGSMSHATAERFAKTRGYPFYLD